MSAAFARIMMVPNLSIVDVIDASISKVLDGGLNIFNDNVRNLAETAFDGCQKSTVS
jgi:hypothetical protein